MFGGYILSKIDMGSGVVTTPEDAEEKQRQELEQLLSKWYKELEGYKFASKADYAMEGLGTLFNEVQQLRAIISRMDTILSSAKQMKRKFDVGLDSVVALYEDELDKLKTNPVSLINKGFSYHEREAYYKSSPNLIGYRLRIRKMQCYVSDIVTFVQVATDKYKSLDGTRNDLLLMTSLVRLGFNFREVDK